MSSDATAGAPLRSPDLTSLFAPTSVAIIGASRDPGKGGGSVLANLRSAASKVGSFP